MQNSISLGLYSNNASILDDSFNRAFGGVTVSPSVSLVQLLRLPSSPMDKRKMAYIEMGRSCSTLVSSIAGTMAKIW